MHSFKTGRLTSSIPIVYDLLALAGCGGQPSRRHRRSRRRRRHRPARQSSGRSAPRLMFITNGTSDWWNAVEKGMRDGAEEFGAEVEMRRPDSESAQQIQKIEDVLEPSRRARRGHLGAGGGFARHRRQDERPSKCRENRDRDRL